MSYFLVILSAPHGASADGPTLALVSSHFQLSSNWFKWKGCNWVAAASSLWELIMG